jgi:S1-C subfamily serine protease
MRIAILGLLTAAFLTAASASAREWRDSTGTHKIDAELVSSANGSAWLKKPSGEVICVPVNRLSTIDREYIRTRSSQPSQPSAPPQTQPQTQFSLVDLTAKVEPAVVRIDAGTSIGSGFVVDPSGLVVTNHHVVEGARSVTVSFRDGSSARVTGYQGVDIAKDIVLLKLSPGPQRTALSVRRELPRKGESVAAFGAPQGLDFSVSQGIVSAVRTDGEIQKSVRDMTGQTQRALDMLWIQTTAAISGGNSGGPLVDMHGEVVGINTKTRTHGQNLNFAVSCQDVSKLVSESFANPLQSLASLPNTKPSNPRRSTPVSTSSSDRFPVVTLPSGASLSHTIVEVPNKWPECNFTEESAARLIKFPNGEPKALHTFLDARLHGPSFLLNEDGEKRWAADYFESDRHGSLRIWDHNSEMSLFSQYVRGGKKGFVCVFDDGMPWLVQEWDKNRMHGEYLVKWNAGVPTVCDSKQVSGQADIGQLAAARERLAELEQDFKAEETDIKRELAQWFRELDREIKRQRAAAVNVRKRKDTLGALKARSAAEKAALGQMWRRAWTGR